MSADFATTIDLISRNGASTPPIAPTEAREQGPSRLSATTRPRVAVVTNSLTPYRIHLHERIAAEVPEIEFWSLATHGNAYNRWTGLAAPSAIRPVDFGHGEPTNEQTQWRFSMREWAKAGRIIRWLKQHKVAAVLCQGCGDLGRLRILRWCHRNRIPCFLTGDFNVHGDKLTGLQRALKRTVYEQAVAWSSGLMPCGASGQALFDRYCGAAKPTFWFPFFPDVTLFERTSEQAVQSVREQFHLDPLRRRIVFSARMMRVKRPDLAIAAFAAVANERREWDLVMLGDGPLRAELEASVPADLRTRIIWTGFLDSPTLVAGLYAQSDVLLLPSDHEPWGVVVVEAAAAGLAIVASDVVGAVPELVKTGRNGMTFSKGDKTSLIRVLRNVTSPTLIDACKRESRRVLHEWQEYADPVAGFRAALVSCKLLEGNESRPKSPRPYLRQGATSSQLV